MATIYQSAVLNAIRKANVGSLTLALPDGSSERIGNPNSSLDADWSVKDLEAFKVVALQGDIGLGESYMRDHWESTDVTKLLQWFLRNRGAIMPQSSSLTQSALKAFLKIGEDIRHYLNRNTREGSRKNIHAHYDLGNDFYRKFLDPSMTYSSAYFQEETDDLEDAQIEKYDRICLKMKLAPEHSLLEIGCGWGGFAVHAAQNYGCRVTATTISDEQLKYAVERVERAGLSDRIQIIHTDYRDLVGRFDRIASIEMLEAVGHEYLSEYFQQLERLLAPHGISVVQVITTPSPLYKSYRQKADWIQKHIFPGANLPSNQALLDATSKLELMHLEGFGLHYAKTLRLWRERFLDNWSEIEPMGFDDIFKRKWAFYLNYCEAGFLERHINVSQMTFCRPDELGYSYERKLTHYSPASPQNAEVAL
ncbi:MAG: cyclopropane-fatty-acyl-phospholipid synthase family protein [Verrucomicrobiota bacterium]